MFNLWILIAFELLTPLCIWNARMLMGFIFDLASLGKSCPSYMGIPSWKLALHVGLSEWYFHGCISFSIKCFHGHLFFLYFGYPYIALTFNLVKIFEGLWSGDNWTKGDIKELLHCKVWSKTSGHCTWLGGSYFSSLNYLKYIFSSYHTRGLLTVIALLFHLQDALPTGEMTLAEDHCTKADFVLCLGTR